MTSTRIRLDLPWIRTALVGALAVAVLLPLQASVPAATADPGATRHGPARPDQPLRALGDRVDLRIGTAVDMDAYNTDTTYRERIATEFSVVTAENVMKWGVVEPERGRYDWTAADQLVAEARRNGQKVRGHTLIWHNQLPAWLTSGTFTADELRAILRKHITDQVRHFRGKIWQWDVANEVIDDNGNLRDTIFLRTLGPGYIADAFRWAHEADRGARLYLNDYNIEGLSAKSDAYYELVKQLRRDRVPVHGLGVQGHLGVQYGFYPAANVAENLGRFERLGLETAVTEADVRMPMPPDAIKLQSQAQGYTTLVQGCLLATRCNSVTVWGFTDKYSWVPGVFEGEGAANLLDEKFQPKPAYDAVRATLALSARR
jgi:endo-1,4-beta-xylanase